MNNAHSDAAAREGDVVRILDATHPERVVAQAIQVLTEAARGPFDFGELACHVMAAVAANVGGVEALLASRPGSWEANHVREMVFDAVGEDPADLLSRRTEPIRVYWEALEGLEALGLQRLVEDDFDAALEELEAAEEALNLAAGTPAELERLDELGKCLPPITTPTEQVDWDMVNGAIAEIREIREGIHERAKETHMVELATLRRATRTFDKVHELWHSDQDEYEAGYLELLQELLENEGIEQEVELVDDPDLTAYSSFEELLDPLTERAAREAPLPVTGLEPDRSHPGATVKYLRAAKMTYLDRARTL